MTKSTSPAANAGLPAIDRRSLVCGLGTAAVAGVPALGSAPTSDDPVFQAMTALEQPLLRFTAGLMEGFYQDDDEYEHYVGAIRNAADFFEGSATA
jgi:hypothetical protein